MCATCPANHAFFVFIIVTIFSDEYVTNSLILRILSPASHQFLDPSAELYSQTQQQSYKPVEVIVVYFTVLVQHVLRVMNKIVKEITMIVVWADVTFHSERYCLTQ
jgi:hypothetical protein